MNPIRLVSGAVTLPAHAAAAVIGTSVGVATTGVRTTARVVARVIEQAVGLESGAVRAMADRGPDDRRGTAGRTAPVHRRPRRRRRETKTPATKAPAKKAAAKKAPAKKAAAKKAPSKQAAVLAPALGLSEAEVEQLDAAIDRRHHHAVGHPRRRARGSTPTPPRPTCTSRAPSR